MSDSTHNSHATNPADSIVPQKVQEKVPEGLERALPDKIHPTNDTKETAKAAAKQDPAIPKSSEHTSHKTT